MRTHSKFFLAVFFVAVFPVYAIHFYTGFSKDTMYQFIRTNTRSYTCCICIDYHMVYYLHMHTSQIYTKRSIYEIQYELKNRFLRRLLSWTELDSIKKGKGVDFLWSCRPASQTLGSDVSWNMWEVLELFFIS